MLPHMKSHVNSEQDPTGITWIERCTLQFDRLESGFPKAPRLVPEKRMMTPEEKARFRRVSDAWLAEVDRFLAERDQDSRCLEAS